MKALLALFALLMVASSNCLENFDVVNSPNIVLPKEASQQQYLAADGDIFVRSFIDVVKVFRADALQIVLVANITSPQGAVRTNGKIFSLATATDLKLWKLNNNTVSQMGGTLFFLQSTQFDVVRIMDDESVLVVNQIPTVPPVLETYVLQNNTWTKKSSLNLPTYPRMVPYGTTAQAFEQQFAIAQYYGNQTLSIYKRNADLSWALTEAAPLTITTGSSTSVIYNGVDTVLLTDYFDDSEKGSIQILQKQGGAWKMVQNITADSLGLVGAGQLGRMARLVHSQQIVFSAFFSNTGLSTTGNVVSLSQLANGTWGNAFVYYTSAWNTFFARVMDAGRNFIVAESDLNKIGKLQYHVVPICPLAPIAVTCSDVVASPLLCEFDGDLQELVDNPQCGHVSISQTSMSASRNNVSLTYKFERDRVASTTCTFNLICKKESSGSVLALSWAILASLVSL